MYPPSKGTAKKEVTSTNKANTDDQLCKYKILKKSVRTTLRRFLPTSGCIAEILSGVTVEFELFEDV